MDEERLEAILSLLVGLKAYEWGKIEHCISRYFNEKATSVEASDDFVENVKNIYRINFTL